MMNPKDYKRLGKHTIAAPPPPPSFFLSTRFVEKNIALIQRFFNDF